MDQYRLNMFKRGIVLITSMLLIVSCSTNTTHTYKLSTSANPTKGGSVSPAEGQFNEGEKAELTAKSNENWVFEKWQGDYSGSENPVSVTMNSDKNITAFFKKREYALTMNTEGEGVVQEQVVQEKSNDYKHGTVVKISANPNEGWKFVEWKGAKTGSKNPVEITIKEPKEITAVFEKKSYDLTVNTEGKGTVEEQVVQSKTSSHEYGTVVKLTANPDEGWAFDKWKGDHASTNNPIEITVDQEKEVTAVFIEKQVKLEVVSGDKQHGLVSESLKEPFVVKAVDQHGDIVSDVMVEFNITEGSGSISVQETKTDNKGRAQTTLQFGNQTGETKVKAQTSNLADYLETGNVVFTGIAEPKLSHWLNGQQKITDAINWETPSGVVNYTNWTEEQKNDLNRMYLRVVNKNLTMENYPPENLYQLTQDPEYTRVETRISRDDAWNLYLMNVANSIAVEKNNIVSWSLESAEYSKEDLKLLLDGRSFYYYNGTQDGTHIYEPKADPFSSFVLPSHPQVAMEFLEEEQILASTRLETIYRLIDWSAVNLRHFLGPFRLGNFEDHWHYQGAIPVDRILNGTDRKDDGSDNVYHHTAGCHGTNNFYSSILRNLNIPVEYDRNAAHATPYFTMQNLYLSHGDDPYSAFYARKPAIHPKKLLIDEQTYNNWFSSQDHTREEIAKNIGRRTMELGVEHLSYYLLDKYCFDKSHGLSKEDGDVFDTLSRHYTLEELKEMNLWQKMDDKLSEIGGCENVDNERIPYY